MKHVSIILLITGFLLQGGPLQAKKTDNLLKADYCYSHMAFADAISYYEKIEGRSEDVRICSRLGDCYRLTNDLQQAAFWYGKAVTMEGCSDTVKLCYGRMLMQLAQYEQAEKFLSRYQVDHPKDKSIANLIVGCRISKESAGLYRGAEPLLLDFNTNGTEFGSVQWKGKLVFTSDSVIGKKKKDKWTGRSYCRMYIAHCDMQGHCDAAFTPLNVAKEGKHHMGPCSFNADGSIMYFTRTSGEAGSIKDRLSVKPPMAIAPLEIMVASGYDEATQQFGTVIPFEYNNGSYSVAHPAISPDGSMLVFCSDMPGGMGGTDLYICTRLGDGRWSKPQNLGNGINTDRDEMFPNFTDNTTLYFSSDGHPGFGGLDIYECLFDRKTRTFTAIKNLGAPFNSSYDDMSYTATHSGIFFTSNRPAAKKGDNIYFVKKEDSVEAPVVATPVVTNRQRAVKDTAISRQGKTGDITMEVAVTDKVTTTDVTIKNKPAHTVKDDTKAGRQNSAGDPAIASKRKPHRVHDVGPYKNIAVNRVFDIPGFYFGFNKADIVSAGAEQLSDVYELLKENPTLKIQIQAYSDCRGTIEINYRISLRRAYALKRYLVGRGIVASRLSCIGYGTTHPVIKCTPCNSCAEEQHQKNRRIAFKVIKI